MNTEIIRKTVRIAGIGLTLYGGAELAINMQSFADYTAQLDAKVVSEIDPLFPPVSRMDLNQATARIKTIQNEASRAVSQGVANANSIIITVKDPDQLNRDRQIVEADDARKEALSKLFSKPENKRSLDYVQNILLSMIATVGGATLWKNLKRPRGKKS